MRSPDLSHLLRDFSFPLHATRLQSGLSLTGSSGNTALFLVDLSGITSDKIAIGGAFDLGGAFDRISFNGSADGTSSYALATYSSIAGTFNSIGDLPFGYILVYGSSELNLVPLAAAPEPGSRLD